MNTKKLELINKIEEKLGSYNLYIPKRDSYLRCESFTESLKWLPEENLQKMLECDLSHCVDFSAAYQVFGRSGALRFEPYIVNGSSDNPSMCIRRDRFLHMFRGYHFQVSGTVDGIMDCGSGAYRTDFLTHSSYYEKVINKGLIAYMLWWAAMIDAGFSFDNFRTLYAENKPALEEFLNTSMKYWNCNCKYGWSDISKYIVFSTGEIDKYSRKMYQLIDKKIRIHFAMGKKSIQVQMSNNKLLTLTIPDLNEGTGYNLEDEDDRDEYESQVFTLEDNHYTEMLTVMALALCGVKISFMGWHLLKEVEAFNLTPINSPDVVTVESLNDIYNKEPDEF